MRSVVASTIQIQVFVCSRPKYAYRASRIAMDLAVDTCELCLSCVFGSDNMDIAKVIEDFEIQCGYVLLQQFSGDVLDSS